MEIVNLLLTKWQNDVMREKHVSPACLYQLRQWDSPLRTIEILFALYIPHFTTLCSLSYCIPPFSLMQLVLLWFFLALGLLFGRYIQCSSSDCALLINTFFELQILIHSCDFPVFWICNDFFFKTRCGEPMYTNCHSYWNGNGTLKLKYGYKQYQCGKRRSHGSV